MSELIKSILSETDLNSQHKADNWKGFIKTEEFLKGTIIQKKGDRFINSYYVKKGLLRSYTIDEKGKEHIFMFASEGWLISDIESQVNNAPAELYIDVLENSEVEIIKRDDLNNLPIIPSDFLNLEVTKLLRRVSVLQKRVLLLMSASALERYQDFIITYPDIVQRVPQKMIASYLGITPEALSKIRAQRVKH